MKNFDGKIKTIGPVADLERHLPEDWWKKLFNSLYLMTDGDVVENEANTVNEIDKLLSAVPIKKDDYVLDLCCGQGRHLLELAKRGYKNLAGIDRSRYLVALAKKRAKTNGYGIKFSEGDARFPRVNPSSIDCVTLLGNSFGYFEKVEDDVLILSGIMKLLKPGGALVLDIVDGPWMSENFEQRSWEWIDKNHFVNRERALDESKSRIISREVITHAEKGVIADQFYAERLYSFEDIQKILRSIGFDNTKLHSNVNADSTRNQDLGMMSNRMFITTQKPISHEVKSTSKKTQSNICVLLGDPSLPDTVKKDGKFNQEDIDTVNRLKSSLKGIGDYAFHYIDHHASLINELQQNKPDFVFNLCDEGFNNKAVHELHIPALLELLDIPYTGSGPETLAICYNKSLVYAYAATLEVPVALQTTYNSLDFAANLPATFPALLKPNCGDSSIGITQNALVSTAEEMINYIEFLNHELPGAQILIQEFLSGNEYSVGIIGNTNRLEALPILEVDYSGLPETLPKILSYESKWLPQSDYWNKISYKEAALSSEAQQLLTSYSYKLFEGFGCRDYARFDFRADRNGTIKLLEVNPNPGWCWDGKFNLMAEFAGMSYQDLLDKILRAAITRLKI